MIVGSDNFVALTQRFLEYNKEDTNFSYEDYTLLIDVINYHAELYNTGTPHISDVQYDQIFSLLIAREHRNPERIVEYSPTQKIIHTKIDGFQQAEHKVPLLSLQNTYNSEDIKQFHDSIINTLIKDDLAHQRYTKDYKHQAKESYNTQLTYRVEPKFDGISIDLVYRGGKLIKAITRGDGYKGEDVTHNVITINNLPHSIPRTQGELHLRGEIVLPKSQLEKINQDRLARQEQIFANARNAAAGSIKLLDSAIVAKRNLICFVYDLLFCDELTYTKIFGSEEKKSDGPTTVNQSDKVINFLKSQGLPIYERQKTNQNIKQIIDICNDEKQKKYFESQDIEFDGLVIKLENFVYRAIVGETNHHPKRAFAYKFPAHQVTTQLIDVTFQVGRTGILTPVGEVKPVNLSGATITKVSLHNIAQITNKNIFLRDYVIIQRSGEVIPHVIGSVLALRDQTAQPIMPPTKCPSCGQNIVQNGDFFYCINPHCPAIIKEKICYFVSKDAMDIAGIGDSIAELLVEQGIVKSIADLYNLCDHKRQTHILALPGIGQKKYQEIVTQLSLSKKNSLRRFLTGLGIQHIGKKMAQDLEPILFTIKSPIIPSDLPRLLTDDRILTMHGIGEQIRQTLTTLSNDQTFLNCCKQFDKYGFVFVPEEKKIGGPLTGTSRSVTGSFDGYSRDQLFARLEENGAHTNNEITSKTTHCLIGRNAGSKLAKAQKNNIMCFETLEACKSYFIGLSDLPQPTKKQQNIPQQLSLFG